MMPLRVAMPRIVRSPTSEPSESVPPLMRNAANTPPTKRPRQSQQGENREAPTVETRPQQEKDGDDCDEGRHQQPLCAVCKTRVFSEQFRVVFERKPHGLEDTLNIAGNGAQIATAR